MPALPSVPGVIRVTLNYITPVSSTSQSRFFIHYSGTAPTATQLQTFSNAVLSAWGSRFNALVPVGTQVSSVFCEDLSSPTGAVASSTGTGQLGTRTGGTLAPGTAAMIQWLIARRYRGGKPKIFLPLGVSTDLTLGTWTVGFTASVATAWTNFSSDFAIAGWTGAGTITQVNVSYFSGFTVVTNPISHRARNVPTLRGTPVVDTIINLAVEQGLASQRRRNLV